MNDFTLVGNPQYPNQPVSSLLSDTMMLENSVLKRPEEQIKIEFKSDTKKVPRVTEFKKFINLIRQRFDEINFMNDD
jgi:hypothetical protein